jgi:CheY-like chemotaxis protein
MPIPRKRILVVDDEEPYFIVVRDLLPSGTFEVVWAQNKVRAVEQMEKRRADLVILDLRLSDRSDDESGIEVLREFRSKWPRVQVIVFSGVYMQPDKIVECIKDGAYYYFIKSHFGTDPARFVTLVMEALAYKPKHDVLEDNYPHPLALVYRDYHRNVVAPYLKFKRLLELVELLVKFSSIICLAALQGDNKISPVIGGVLMRPSLGKWFEFLQQALTAPSNDTIWIENLRKTFTQVNGRNVASLIQVRNEWGHGATRSDHEYGQIVQQWDGAVMELLSAASILSVWQLFTVKSTRFLANRGRLHTVINLRGHNPKFLSEEILLPADCEADKVYAYDPESHELLCLDPFVAVFVCDQCNQETVFVYDKADRDKVLYLDYANGHHSSRTEPFRAVKSILGG